MDVLIVKKPELAKEIKEIVRSKNKEGERKETKEQEVSNNGFWEYDYDTNDFSWTGQNPPSEEDGPNPSTCQIPL